MTHRDLAPSLPRVRWTAHVEPIHLPLAQLIYQLRRHDADDGLLLDALTMADMAASVEQWLALDALISPYAQLERKMQMLQRTLSRVSRTLKPVALQLTPPFRQHGSAQVTAIFELSDGQTVSIYFHNPDTTPHKLNPNDELVSWKWLLNKKDITIVVAPEKGHDLNLLDVATRVIKLAEKNSNAFIRANVKRAERVEEINRLNAEIEALEKELATVQRELELIEFQRNEAQQQAEQRKKNKENKPDALTNVVIPAGLTEAEMAVLIASIYRKPYMRMAQAREMLSPEDMEQYASIQQKLIDIGYINKSGIISQKGKERLEEFANQFDEDTALAPWIAAQKQKQHMRELEEQEKEDELNKLPQKIIDIADILDKTYDYDSYEDEDDETIIKLGLPPALNDERDESDSKWIIKPNSDATQAQLIFNQASITIDHLQTLPAAELAAIIHHIIIRFQGKTDGYIRAIQYLEQGATQAGLHVHYGDFNHSISGGLLDTVSGSNPIVGITAQLHADGNVWARARISETGELVILFGSAGDHIVGQANNAEEVTDLLRGLMRAASSKVEKVSKNSEEFTTPKKPYSYYLHEANGDRLLASKAYFTSELMAKYIKTVIGKVWLLGSSRGKMIYGRGKRTVETKVKIIPFVPEILKEGKYEGRDELYKQRDDAYIAFHAFTKEITTDGCIFNVRIYVGEREKDRYEFVAYDMKASKEKGNPTTKQNFDSVDSVKWNPLLSGNVLKVTPDAVQRPQERTTDVPSVSPCVIRRELPEHFASASANEQEIQHTLFDKVNPKTEAAWNIRILKVVDVATGQRHYELEDGAEDNQSIQRIVSNQAEHPDSKPAVAPKAAETAALYAFDETRTHAQRKADNAAALALLKAIDAGEKDGQTLSVADKAILAKYSGTGGALIGVDGKKGSAYEYYTPAPIAAGMWDLLKALGFSGGKALDPCAGTGVFSAMAPDNAVIDAVELNETSGKVNQCVNHKMGCKTTIAPFEQVASATPDEIYDAVISNVPFGGVADRGGNQLLDNKYQKEPLQTYFILRSLEKLRPGGLALFIVPPRCVSGKGGKEEHLRIKISYLVEFLGAYRLPNKVFGTANADTMTDIIALRKYSSKVLEKIDELRQQAPEILIKAHVQWPVFTQGHYFKEEGKRFILGEFIPKDPTKFRDVDRVIIDKPVAEIAHMLATFPDSRIDWTLLESIQTLPIMYHEGDSIYQAGQTLVLHNGQWITAENHDQDTHAAQLTAELTHPYKTFAAQLSYEQVNKWFDYMIQAGPLNVPAWLRSLMSGLNRLDNPAQREQYWQAGVVALSVQQILDERLVNDEPVDFLGGGHEKTSSSSS